MIDLLATERRAFADFYRGLTPDERAAPSLCSEWSVRDVVGHVVANAVASKAATMRDVMRSGFVIGRANTRGARRFASLGDDHMLAELDKNAASPNIPAPGLKLGHLLADTVIHQQDCRRPLGFAPREFPEAAMRIALDLMVRQQMGLGNRKRIAGVELQATDLDWKWGAGPPVRGTAEALLMVTSGRGAALADLEGEGVAVLSLRFGGR